MSDKTRPQKYREGICPSCGKTGRFSFIGIQHWAEEIAERLNIPATVELYQCEHCMTTVSEPLIKAIE